MCSILRLHLLAVSLLAAVLYPATTPAQPVARSFTELANVVSVGQTVTVTDAAGVEIKGRVTQLSPTSLTVAADAAARTFAENEIRLIQQRRSDSVLNGTLIGAAVGLGAMAIIAVAVCANQDCSWDDGGEVAAVFAIYGGIGAGIGALVDYGVKGNKTVFVPAEGARPSVSIAPLIGRDRKGVQVALRF